MAETPTIPITKIKSATGNNADYELGSLFQNVYLGTIEGNPNILTQYTLLDLYRELQNYFTNGNFILYSEEDPQQLEQIKIWFQTYSEEENSSEEG